jgi:hypothetical protein
MPYAVLQPDLNPPRIEQLQRAFRFVPGLTPGDAHILSRDAFGILVKDFSKEQAGALQGALRNEGIETEIVDQSWLPELPPKKLVQRLDCTPEHLLIYDPLGRSFPLDWRHVMLVAAGVVQLSEFVQYQETRANPFDFQRYQAEEPERETVFRETQQLRLMAEIVITGAVLRYSVAAEKFNFAYLGERNTRNAAANFSLLVRDIIQHSPNTGLNRGAATLRVDATQIFEYPSKNAFYEEIVWMLWQIKKTA